MNSFELGWKTCKDPSAKPSPRRPALAQIAVKPVPSRTRVALPSAVMQRTFVFSNSELERIF